jgi:hypothetical protein
VARINAGKTDYAAENGPALAPDTPLARLPAAGRLELSLLRRQAPAAAFGTPTIPEFFSTRVGCKAFPPVSFGVDLAALCLPRK